MTDVCIKRKVREYISMIMQDDALKNKIMQASRNERGYNILVRPDVYLNEAYANAFVEESISVNKTKKDAHSRDEIVQARNHMLRQYYDVRMFGMVMSTGENPCGIVRGPVQIGFAESLSPISVQNITITRSCFADADRKKKVGNAMNEMGSKSFVPYGLYRLDGSIAAAVANKENDDANITDTDVKLLWDAFANMLAFDRSTMRGRMECKGLYIFKHDSMYGSCPSDKLFSGIKITTDVVSPRRFEDYTVEIDDVIKNNGIKGVTFTDYLNTVPFGVIAGIN